MTRAGGAERAPIFVAPPAHAASCYDRASAPFSTPDRPCRRTTRGARKTRRLRLLAARAIPRTRRARDARSGGSPLRRASRRRSPRRAARCMEQSRAGRGGCEGASTIAMQVARMQAPAPRSFLNKLKEAATGIAIVARNGREATLAHYLRLAPYGLGSHGIAHAARFYFDKPVDDLSWAQVALLAAIPQSPGRMNITRESGLRLAVARARYAIARLEQEGALDAAQAEMARRELEGMRPFEREAPARGAASGPALRASRARGPRARGVGRRSAHPCDHRSRRRARDDPACAPLSVASSATPARDRSR